MMDSAVCALQACLVIAVGIGKSQAGSPKPDHRECPSHPTVSCPNLASPKPRAASNFVEFVNFTGAKRRFQALGFRWRKLRVRFRRSQNYVIINAVFAMNVGLRVFRRGDHFEKSLPRRVTNQHHKLAVLGLRSAFARGAAIGVGAAHRAVARAEHPRIHRVHYPGLVSHPQHELARRQMRAFGAMIAVEVDGSPDDARRFLERCRLFTLAESLGGVESLISLPALMTHASTPPEVRAALGITDRLVRISVGIEDDDDLIADLNASFATVRTPSPGGGEAAIRAPTGLAAAKPGQRRAARLETAE